MTEREEDIAKYSAFIALSLDDGEREAAQRKHGILGLTYVIAGLASRFERRTRRRDWEKFSEKNGYTWDIVLSEFIEGEL